MGGGDRTGNRVLGCAIERVHYDRATRAPRLGRNCEPRGGRARAGKDGCEAERERGEGLADDPGVELLEAQATPVGELPLGELVSERVGSRRVVDLPRGHVVDRKDQVVMPQLAFPVEEPRRLAPALLTGEERRCEDGNEHSGAIDAVLDPAAPRLSPADLLPVL